VSGAPLRKPSQRKACSCCVTIPTTLGRSGKEKKVLISSTHNTCSLSVSHECHEQCWVRLSFPICLTSAASTQGCAGFYSGSTMNGSCNSNVFWFGLLSRSRVVERACPLPKLSMYPCIRRYRCCFDPTYSGLRSLMTARLHAALCSLLHML
jgi:hypothetical protein